MCVIYVAKDKLPSLEEMENGALTNDDGAGVAWLGTNNDPQNPKPKVWWKKGFASAKEVHDFIQKENLPLPLVIHFRSASIGGKSPYLTHPFPVSAGAELLLHGYHDSVLFHNGTVTKWDDYTLAAGLAADIDFPGGAWSDSRALAWLTHLKGSGVLPFVVNSSRVVVFHSTPDANGDHFEFFGSWLPQDGFTQSCSTEFGRGKVIYAGMSGGAGSTNGWNNFSRTTKQDALLDPDVWTVDELKEILESLEKERANVAPLVS